jgi:hypothetical protein
LGPLFLSLVSSLPSFAPFVNLIGTIIGTFNLSFFQGYCKFSSVALKSLCAGYPGCSAHTEHCAFGKPGMCELQVALREASQTLSDPGIMMLVTAVALLLILMCRQTACFSFELQLQNSSGGFSFYELPLVVQNQLLSLSIPVHRSMFRDMAIISDHDVEDKLYAAYMYMMAFAPLQRSPLDDELKEAFRVDAGGYTDATVSSSVQNNVSHSTVTALCLLTVQLLEHAITAAKSDLGYEAAMLSIIAHKGSDVRSALPPDWHIDLAVHEKHGQATRQPGHVVVVQLKGSPTLYVSLDEHVRNAITSSCSRTGHVYCDVIGNIQDQRIVEEAILLRKVESAVAGRQGSIHLAGKASGAMHASPSAGDRLLLIIQFGTLQQITLEKSLRGV